LLNLACAVEPSDSSALPGLWAIDHVAASRAVPRGTAASDWHVVAVDNDTPVDTLALHARSGPGPRIPDDTLAQLRAADPRGLARLATASALRNQQRLPHPAFAALQKVVATTNALGICVAHSGSVCAAICADADSARTTTAAVRALGLSCVTWRVAAPGMHVEVRRPAVTHAHGEGDTARRTAVCNAIEKRRLLRFHYHGSARLVVPCAHGLLSTGNEALRAHEVSAMTLGKLFRVDAMESVEVCPDGFTTPPPGYRRDDRGMARIHCQL
jgi:hypothetical protein